MKATTSLLLLAAALATTSTVKAVKFETPKSNNQTGVTDSSKDLLEKKSRGLVENENEIEPADGEGRFFGLLDGKIEFVSDLLLSAHCMIDTCRRDQRRAYYCCTRDFTHACCRYAYYLQGSGSGATTGWYGQPGVTGGYGYGGTGGHHHHHVHEHQKGYGSGGYYVQPTMSSSVGYYPPPPGPGPILPPLPVNSFNLHHHEHYNRDGYGGSGGRYKPGECPRVRSSSYQYNRGRPQPGYPGDPYYRDTTSPGIAVSRDTCRYDYDCPGREKCCYTEVNRSLYSMICRYPIGGSTRSRDRYYYKK